MTPFEVRVPLLAAIVAVLGCGEGRPADEDGAGAAVAAMSLHEQAAHTVAARLQIEVGELAPALEAELATGAAGAVLLPSGAGDGGSSALAAARAAAPWEILTLVSMPAISSIPPPAWFAALAESEALRDAGAAAAGEGRRAGGDLLAIDLSVMNGHEPLGALQADHELMAGGTSAFVQGAVEGGGGVMVTPFIVEAGDGVLLRWDRARLGPRELSELEQVIAAGSDRLVIRLPATRIPALTGDSGPLALSAAAIHGLLRRDLQFDGVIAADPMEIADAMFSGDSDSAAVALLDAGVDLLVGVRSPAALVDAIVAAVRAGSLDSVRVAEAARRVVRLRLALSSPEAAVHGVATATEVMVRSETRLATIAAKAAQNAVEGRGRAADSAVALHAGGGDAGEATPAVAGIIWPPVPTFRQVQADSLGISPGLAATVDGIIREALADSLFTAAAVAIGRREGVALLEGWGREGRAGAGEPVDPAVTLFDLASLTKAIGTATATALLVEDGRLELDAPVDRYIAGFRGAGKGDVTVRHLLTHTSGLPAGRWLFGSARSPGEALAQVQEQRLVRDPGARVEYSDLGMILLAAVVEEAAETSIDLLLAERILTPLGMMSTMYLPPLVLRDRIAPTAEITERDFPLMGIVHDANAFRLGGVAGHAGLFSTARDVAVFAQMMLNGGGYGTARILSAAVVDTFTRRQAGAGQRALGWDTPSRVSSAGEYFSPRSFGHTGYTGTSLWIDPANDVFVVLLTNRTYTETTAREMLLLRAAVHDAAARALTDRTVPRRPR